MYMYNIMLKLVGIVTYHLIGGSYYKASLLPYNTSHPGVHDTFLPTLEGGQLVFSLDTDGNYVICWTLRVCLLHPIQIKIFQKVNCFVYSYS